MERPLGTAAFTPAYRAKVRFLKSRWGNAIYRRWVLRDLRGAPPSVRDYLERFAPGKTVADVGGMWGIDGRYAFLAEELGATEVMLVDAMEPTDEFERTRRERGSRVRAIVGAVESPSVLEQFAPVDVIWCSGVLYHHPTPMGLLSTLYGACTEVLLLETLTVPEMAVANGAVYYPLLPDRDRRLWNTAAAGGAGVQLGMTEPFDASKGYANNYWGMSPSCVRAMAESIGFRVETVAPSFAGRLRHVFVCHRR